MPGDHSGAARLATLATRPNGAAGRALPHLVGDAGAVTTIDLDADIVDAARVGLDAAGYTAWT